MSTATKTLLIVVKQQGLDQVNTSIKGLTSTSQAATKATDGLGQAFSKGQGDVLKLRTGVVNLDKAESKASKSVDTFSKSTNNAGKSTSGLAAKFQGNKGLIFSTVGIATAGLEAVGMFQQYQNATAKVSEAQDRLNQLERMGMKDSQLYTQAQKDLTDANRSAQFAFRILALSVGDLIPFSLLLINSLVKLKDTVSGGAKPAIDAMAKSTTAFGTAATTTSTGGLRGFFNSLTQGLTGTKNFDTGLKTVNTTTGTFNNALGNLQTGFTNTNTKVLDATRLIGTGRNGLVGGVSGLSIEMDKTNKMSTRFKDAFTQIGVSIKNLPTTFKSIGSSVASFFTNFGTNIGKFGGMLKTAGAAVMTFSKTMLLAFLSNPITAAIAGISAAVLALATDFGGIRTAINNFGVAVGNAIPAAKGILQAIGDTANGALDYIANLLGVQKQTDSAGEAALKASPKFVQLTNAIKDSQTLGPIFDNLRKQIDNLHTGTDFYTKDSIIGYKNVQTTAEASLTAQQKKIPEVSAVLKELAAATTDNAVKGKTLAQVQDNLNLIITKLQTALVGASTKQNTLTTGTEKNVGATQKAVQATDELTQNALAVASAMMKQAAEGKGVEAVLTDNQKAMVEYLTSQGIMIEDMETLTTADKALIAELTAIAPALKTMGQNIELVNGRSIDWTKTIGNIVTAEQNLKKESDTLWSTMKDQIDRFGIPGLQAVEAGVKLLEEAHHPLAKIIRETFEDYKGKLQESGKYVEYLGSEEEKQAKKTKTAADTIAEKANKLGILNDIQGLSLQNQKNAITITEQQNKTDNAAMLTLQKLAVARGLDISKIQMTSSELLTYINTHAKATATVDEVNAAIAELVDKRQEEAKQTNLATQAQQGLLTMMGKVPPVLGMTNKGLETLVQLYDDTANAVGLAADQVGTWWAELQKSQKVDDATVQKLDELAKSLGIKVPDAIKQKGIPAIQEYISKVTGIGPAAKKAAEEATKAFNDLSGKARSAVEGLIDEAVLDGKAKKVEKILAKVGKSISDLDSQSAIIEIAANDDDFTNKMKSIPEIISTTFKGAAPQARAGAEAVISEFSAGIMDEFGSAAGPIINTIDSLWAQVKKENPKATGAELVNLFTEAINDPAKVAAAAKYGITDPLTGELKGGLSGLSTIAGTSMDDVAASIFGKGAHFEDAGAGLADSTATGFTSGSHAFATVGDKAMYDLLKTYDPAKAEAYAKANAIAGQTESGFTSGAGHIMTAGEQAMYNLLAPYGKAAQDAYAKSLEIADKTKQGVDTIPGKTQTSLAPVPGIFSQAFVDASTQAGTQLSGILTKVQTTMSNMSTSVATYSQSMNVNFATAIQNMGIPLLPFGEAIYALQGVLSTFSTSVATYSTSMSTNITTFVSTSIAQLTTLSEYINGTLIATLQLLMETVGTVATTMTTAIGAWITASIKSMGELIKVITTTQKTFSTLSTSVATYMNSMKTNIANFQKGATTSLGAAGKAATALQKSLSDLSKNTATYTKSMAANLKSFSTSAVSSLNAVKKAADQATKALEAMARAAAKAKSARSGLRFGGAFSMGSQSMNQSSFAQTGKSWINSRPRKIGGVNISEFSKPELVTVTPLSNPSDPMDKGLSFLDKLPAVAPKLQMPNNVNTSGGGTGARTGTTQPINVNLHTTITMPDGKVLAKAVQQHLLSGFSGIT